MTDSAIEAITMPDEFNFKLQRIRFPDLTDRNEEWPDAELILAHLDNENTGIKVTRLVTNNSLDIEAIKSYAAARASRSGQSLEGIVEEIFEGHVAGRIDASKRIAAITNTQKHASPQEFYHVCMNIHNLPIHLVMDIFQLSTLIGQELSTRYFVMDGKFNVQDFDSNLTREQVEKIDSVNLSGLNNKWQELVNDAKGKYTQWFEIIKNKYKELLETDGKYSDSTLTARALDIARMFVLAGSETSVIADMSIRTWRDLIVRLKSVDDKKSNDLAAHLELMLTADKYEEGTELAAKTSYMLTYTDEVRLVEENLCDLKSLLDNDKDFQKYLNLSYSASEVKPHRSNVEIMIAESPGLATVMQYISAIYPTMSENYILEYLRSNYLEPEKAKEISRAVFKGHNQHKIMTNIGDVRSSMIIVIKTALAYVRDFQRHRAFGRFIPIISSKDFEAMLNEGFNDNYQMNVTEIFKAHTEAWKEDMADYYRKLKELYYEIKETLGPDADYRFMMNLLPLAHQTKLHMSGPATQMSYLLGLRDGPGNDFANLEIIELLSNKLNTADPYLAGITEKIVHFDPNSPADLKKRS